jgi:hypothetical protein
MKKVCATYDEDGTGFFANWTFDYFFCNFFCNAAKRPLKGRFAAYLVLALIFPETLTASAFQGKSAQFSQKSSCREVPKDRE